MAASSRRSGAWVTLYTVGSTHAEMYRNVPMRSLNEHECVTTTSTLW